MIVQNVKRPLNMRALLYADNPNTPQVLNPTQLKRVATLPCEIFALQRCKRDQATPDDNNTKYSTTLFTDSDQVGTGRGTATLGR